MDDRGKYIYISQEEMQAVADYIKRQGRVSISHLASKSNQFIDLEPKAQFVEEISSAEEIVGSWPDNVVVLFVNGKFYKNEVKLLTSLLS